MVDCCNALLADSMLSTINELQKVLNAAAKVIYGRNKYNQITLLIRNKLHWLRISERIVDKLCQLTYKATQTGTALHCGLLSVYGFGGIKKQSTISIFRTSTRPSCMDEVWGSQLHYCRTSGMEQPTIGSASGRLIYDIQRKAKNICLASPTSDYNV